MKKQKRNRMYRHSKPRHPNAPVNARAAAGEEFVKIPVAEYTGMVANIAALRIVKRMIDADSQGSYIQNQELRVVLGMPMNDEAGQ